MASAYRSTNPVQPGQSLGLLNGIESPTTTRDHGRAPVAEAVGSGFGDGGLPVRTTEPLPVGSTAAGGVRRGVVEEPAALQAATSDATAKAWMIGRITAFSLILSMSTASGAAYGTTRRISHTAITPYLDRLERNLVGLTVRRPGLARNRTCTNSDFVLPSWRHESPMRVRANVSRRARRRAFRLRVVSRRGRQLGRCRRSTNEEVGTRGVGLAALRRG